MNKFARVLKSISIFWCVAALGNAVLSAMVGRQSRVMTHVVLLAIGFAVLLLAHWLGKRSAARKVSAVKARWWQSDYGFRLAILISVSWIVGSFLWQDSYDRNYSIVLGPGVFMLAMYFAHKLFVAPRPLSEERREEAADQVLEAVETSFAVEEVQTSSADRERAMDDLIKQMKAR